MIMTSLTGKMSSTIRRLSRAEAADIRSNIPTAVFWSDIEVADWIEQSGFPQYKVKFLKSHSGFFKMISDQTNNLSVCLVVVPSQTLALLNLPL